MAMSRPRRPPEKFASSEGTSGAAGTLAPAGLLLHTPAVKETLAGRVLPDIGGVTLFIGILGVSFLQRRIAGRIGIG